MLSMPEVGTLLVLASLLHGVALRAGLHNSKNSIKRTVRTVITVQYKINEQR
jgi:hypothetical protein